MSVVTLAQWIRTIGNAVSLNFISVGPLRGAVLPIGGEQMTHSSFRKAFGVTPGRYFSEPD